MATNIKLSANDTQIDQIDPLNAGNGVAGAQTHADITALPNGDFVVVYQNPFAGGTDQDIMAEEFTADGTMVGAGPYRLEFDSGNQILPKVAPELGGGIVAVWEDDANSNSISLAVVHPGAPPNPPELTVFDPGYKLVTPAVATYADGSHLVAWVAEQPTENDLQYSLVNAAGTSATAPTTIPNGFGDDGQEAIATSGNEAMLVWSHFSGGQANIHMELIGSNGAHGTDEMVVFDPFDDFRNPDVAALSDGRFVVVWEEQHKHDIQGKIYDPTTDKFTPTFTISDAGGDQTKPQVAALPDGGFFVTWTDDSHAVGYDTSGTGIYGQRFDSAGSADGDVVQVNHADDGNDQFDSAVAADASGHVAAVWTNQDVNAFADNDGSIGGQFMQLTTDVVNGTAGNDTITTYSLGETINGLGGDDVIMAGGGNDTINGGTGADLMVGGTGNDNYVVDDPGDIVVEHPNEGIDAVSSSIDYTLPDNVERLVITGGAHNATGNDLDNAIVGNANDNVIDGGAGADTMAGGKGNDTYIVDNVGDVVIESTNSGIDTIKTSVDYTLPNNVENLVLLPGATHGTGNALDNIITGNDGDNTITGGGGNDSIDGGAGNDTAVYSGARLQYHVDLLQNGDLQIIDLRPGSPDGTDIVHGVENFAFADGTVSAATLVTPPSVHWSSSTDVGSHPGGYQPAGFGDFNADGTSDALWFNPSTGDADLWKITNGQWAGSSDLGSHPGGYQLAGVGDLNGDGTSDVLWFNPASGDVDLWKIANGQWSGSVDIGSHPAGSQIAGVGDFNGDGTSDVLWYNAATNDAEVWTISNGHWAASTDIGTHPAGFQIAGVGDFNHDGTSDVLWFNQATGQTDLWMINNGHWAASSNLGVHPAGYQPAAVGDFAHDGSADILWYNPTSGDTDLWKISNGHWGGSDDLGVHPAGWQPAGAGDFNHDGISDVAWFNPTTNHLEEWILSNS